jgi:ketosteroid isomerase-like protein
LDGLYERISLGMRGEEGDVRVVKRAFEALSRRDIRTLLDVAAPNVEFLAPATATLAREGRSYRGHDGIFRYFRDVDRVWEELELIPHRYRPAGDGQVVVIGRVRARGQGGYIVDEGVSWLVDVRDGKVTGSRPCSAAEAAALDVRESAAA